jgi:hypothetical protein
MSRQPDDDSKELQQHDSVDSGKLMQNPQPPRNQEQTIPPAKQAKDEGHAPTTGDRVGKKEKSESRQKPERS